MTRSDEVLHDFEGNTVGNGIFSFFGGETGWGGGGLGEGLGDSSDGSVVGGGERLEVYPRWSGAFDTEDFA